MSNFLQICRAVRLKTGLQGTGPSTVTSVSGLEGQIVGAVQDVWKNLQNFRQEWRWSRDRAEVIIDAGDTTKTLLQILGSGYRFRVWHKDQIYAKPTSTGKYVPLRYVEWDSFVRGTINNTTAQKIKYYTIRPEDYAIVFIEADEEHTLKVEYQKSIQNLTADADVPEMPTDYHDILVYAAVEIMAAQVGNPGIYDQYAQEQIRLTNALMREQLPKKHLWIAGGIA